MTDLPFACRCGTVRGTLQDASPAVGTRLICYCRDCRDYARHIGDEDVLDAAGGTELYQTSAARLRIEAGKDRIACLRMTRRGPLRWHAACCGSALANTAPTAAVPFAGVFTARLLGDLGALGPVVAQVFTEAAEAAGGRPPRKFGIAAVFLRFARVTVAARLAGDHCRNPFFPDGRPLAEPAIFTADGRSARNR